MTVLLLLLASVRAFSVVGTKTIMIGVTDSSYY